MKSLYYLLFLTLIISCSTEKNKKDMQTEGQTVYPPISSQIDTLTNSNGMKAIIMHYGGRVVSLYVPDRNGKLDDVVLGYDSANQYPEGNPYFGALIGRYGNRIAKGKFTLDGKEYQLAVNNGVNALHGGPNGFHNVLWKKDSAASTATSLVLRYTSKNGEEGFPGTLDVKVTYAITDQNELTIDYEATTDATTIINLTHHSFFNLAGAGNGDILDHELTIHADRFTVVDEGLIPTGELRNVAGTPFDFTKPFKIGERINKEDEQLKNGKGYDHNWVLTRKDASLALVASVREPQSGRVMEVWTTEPGLQFYSGNFLDGTDIGKEGKKYVFRSAFCLETQHFPDSPNHPEFPTTVLKSGEVYKHQTAYKFKAQ